MAGALIDLLAAALLTSHPPTQASRTHRRGCPQEVHTMKGDDPAVPTFLPPS